MLKAWFTEPGWQDLRAAVVTERAVWNNAGPVAVIGGPGLGMSEREIVEDPIPADALLLVRCLMVRTIDAAYRAGYAIIDQRSVN